MWQGAHVRKADSSYGIVEASKTSQRSQQMYDLTVDTAHTFFVGSNKWLVHNDNCFVTPGGAVAPTYLQGTSKKLEDFTGIEGLSKEQMVARVPKDWTVSAMADESRSIGGGFKFTSPDGLKELRIHGPTNNADIITKYPNDPGVLGWTARVGEKNPTFVHPTDKVNQYVDGWHFIYRDTNGNIVSLRSAEGHIPLKGNPYLYIK